VIARFDSLLGGAQSEGRAVAAFGCYDLEGAVAVLRAAGVGRRVVLLLPAGVLREAADGMGVAALRAAAAYAPGRVCLQADHVQDLETLELACRIGVGAVMADGSQLPFDANVEFVRRAVRIARQYGVSVEGEIGRLPGGPDTDAPEGPGARTDVREAAEFVARTGVDCLAVAIGNVHGTIVDGPPDLDWELLAGVRARVDVPLSLHGGSGLEAPIVRRAVLRGITKVNVNTDLRRAYLDATGRALPDVARTADVAALHSRQAAAVEAVAARALAALDTAHPTVAGRRRASGQAAPGRLADPAVW
jgi:ketose-bisphosphate aldolase